MALPSGQNQYLQTQVLTASREQLVLMLYDGALRFCESAKRAWEKKNLEVSHKSLVRAQSILLELIYALDKTRDPELTARLNQLYAYCYKQLVLANVQRDSTLIDEVEGILRDLRETWAEAMEKLAKQAPSPPPAPAAAPASPEMPPTPGAPSPPEVNGEKVERPHLSLQG
ncbi:MAG: flagellar export chaperone FliS [Planctomycetota bacterium]